MLSTDRRRVDRLLVIRPKEKPEVRALLPNVHPFDEAREIICGYIAPVDVSVPMIPEEGSRSWVKMDDAPPVTLFARQGWVDEDGLALGKPGNSLASSLIGQPIVGTLVVELKEGDDLTPFDHPIWQNKNRGVGLDG